MDKEQLTLFAYNKIQAGIRLKPYNAARSLTMIPDPHSPETYGCNATNALGVFHVLRNHWQVIGQFRQGDAWSMIVQLLDLLLHISPTAHNSSDRMIRPFALCYVNWKSVLLLKISLVEGSMLWFLIPTPYHVIFHRPDSYSQR